MTAKKKSHSKSPAHEAMSKGASFASKAAKASNISPFLITNPNQMESMMTKGKSQFDKLASDANSLSREGLDALNKSMTIFAKGFEDLMRTTMSIAQSAAEKQSQMIKEAMSSKTINEWTEAQSKMAQSNFDDCVAACTKLSEMSTRVLTESAEPINGQLTKGMKKASDALAA